MQNCVHAMKACKGNRGIAPHILDLGTRWNFTPLLIYALQTSTVANEKRAELNAEPLWAVLWKRNILSFPGLELPTVQPLVGRCTEYCIPDILVSKELNFEILFR